MKATVKVDTREKKPYGWTENDWCTGYIVEKLDVGDYSLVGYEDILTIERKASTAEIATNISEPRFEKELEKMSKFKYSFMICEFNMEDIVQFPINSGIPQHKWEKVRVTNKYILKKMIEYQVAFNIKIIYCGNPYNSWLTVNSIFKRVMECEKR